jgi:hypothetical protein
MDYRGYHLEEKTLMVGWQITITKDGTFVRNGSIFKGASEAIAEAQALIDSLLAPPR